MTRAPPGERGAALLLAVVLAALLTVTSASALTAALEAARETRAREEVLCARYAALGAATARARGAHWRPTTASSSTVEVVTGSTGSLAVRATASCKRATREAIRPLATRE